MTRILIIDGHPDPRPERLGRALVAAYAAGATEASHDVRIIKVGDLGLPVLRTAEEFASSDPPMAVRRAQEDFRWAQHVVIFHPLWLGSAPALLKGFFEQVFRYGFALSPDNPLARPLKGRSARIVVTMGMPRIIYSLVFGAFGVRALERSVLSLAGFRPVRRTLLGGVGASATATYGHWLARMRALGGAAQ